MKNIADSYLPRDIDSELLNWKEDKHHKPLLIRGARQVGKSSAVRQLAKSFKFFTEINFERDERFGRIFDGELSPKRICNELSAITTIPIIPGNTLVFLDEIQGCEAAINSLRFFYWQREDKYTQAEVDYLIVINGEIIPVEVKAGKRGSLQSMYIFLEKKGLTSGIRCALEPFSSYNNISVYPLYAVSNFIQNP